MNDIPMIYVSPKTLASLFDLGKTKTYELINEYEAGGGTYIKDGRVHRVKVGEFTSWLERKCNGN